MSASIYYQPVKGICLQMGAKSSFMEAMRRAFGPEPWSLGERDYHTLVGMATGLSDEDHRAAADSLANAINEFSEIRVWAEY